MAEAERALEEEDPGAWSLTPQALAWRSHSWSVGSIEQIQKADSLLVLDRARLKSRSATWRRWDGFEKLDRVRQRFRPAIFRSRTCRTAYFAMRTGRAIGVAIGDQIFDLGGCASEGLLKELPSEVVDACTAQKLNPLMALGPKAWSALRARDPIAARRGLDSCSTRLASHAVSACATPKCSCRSQIGDYTDFYASIHHATRVGKLFRPDNPLLPNYKYVPIGYHGRASSIVVSGAEIRRPSGQTKPHAAARAGVRCGALARLRTRSGLLHRHGQRARRADPHRRSGAAHLRHVPGERLVRARYPVVGVSAARPVPGKELCDHHLAVGRDHGSTGAVSRARSRAARRRSRAACRILHLRDTPAALRSI